MSDTIIKLLQIWGALILSWAAVILFFGFFGALLTGQFDQLKKDGIRSIVELFIFLTKYSLLLLIIFLPPGAAMLFLEKQGYSDLDALIGYVAVFAISIWIAMHIGKAIDIALKKYGYKGD